MVCKFVAALILCFVTVLTIVHGETNTTKLEFSAKDESSDSKPPGSREDIIKKDGSKDIEEDPNSGVRFSKLRKIVEKPDMTILRCCRNYTKEHHVIRQFYNTEFILYNPKDMKAELEDGEEPFLEFYKNHMLIDAVNVRPIL